MKKNKLQEFADKSLEKYDNKELYEKLSYNKPDGNVLVVNNTKRNWFVFLAIIFLCAVVILSTYFLLNKPNKEKRYLLDNQQKTRITEEELLSNIANLSINNKFLISCQEVNDNLYNETLYYEINFQNDESFENLTIVIVTNSEYKHSFNHEKYDRQDEYMKIRYVEIISEIDGLYSYDSKGEFTNKDIQYYASYKGFGLDTQSNFIDFLQYCIQIN